MYDIYLFISWYNIYIYIFKRDALERSTGETSRLATPDKGTDRKLNCNFFFYFSSLGYYVLVLKMSRRQVYVYM